MRDRRTFQPHMQLLGHRGGRLLAAWPALGALAALVPALWMWGFTVDDALIAIRYARHLNAGIGWRFNAHGPSTDGVTPLPWPALLAPLAWGDAAGGAGAGQGPGPRRVGRHGNGARPRGRASAGSGVGTGRGTRYDGPLGAGGSARRERHGDRAGHDARHVRGDPNGPPARRRPAGRSRRSPSARDGAVGARPGPRRRGDVRAERAHACARARAREGASASQNACALGRLRPPKISAASAFLRPPLSPASCAGSRPERSRWRPSRHAP